MIKKVLTNEGASFTLLCDICNFEFATCKDFEYKEGQELMYSPLLCEKCGSDRIKYVNNTENENRFLKGILKQIDKKLKELTYDTEFNHLGIDNE